MPATICWGGGRKVNPIIMALSYGATFISASAIVGFGGVAATFGMGIQWLCLLNMFMGVVIAFIVFGRNTRKLGEKYNARTFPQLLGAHYKSRSIQVFIAAVIFIGMPLYAAVVMKGGAVFIEQMFHIDLHLALLIFTLIVAAYVITGGGVSKVCCTQMPFRRLSCLPVCCSSSSGSTG